MKITSANAQMPRTMRSSIISISNNDEIPSVCEKGSATLQVPRAQHVATQMLLLSRLQLAQPHPRTRYNVCKTSGRHAAIRSVRYLSWFRLHDRPHTPRGAGTIFQQLGNRLSQSPQNQ